MLVCSHNLQTSLLKSCLQWLWGLIGGWLFVCCLWTFPELHVQGFSWSFCYNHYSMCGYVSYLMLLQACLYLELNWWNIYNCFLLTLPFVRGEMQQSIGLGVNAVQGLSSNQECATVTKPDVQVARCVWVEDFCCILSGKQQWRRLQAHNGPTCFRLLIFEVPIHRSCNPPHTIPFVDWKWTLLITCFNSVELLWCVPFAMHWRWGSLLQVANQNLFGGFCLQGYIFSSLLHTCSTQHANSWTKHLSSCPLFW